jgi:hypothetical protein
LYKYGLRTEKSFLRPPKEVKEFLPQNPNPETLSYMNARLIIQTFVDDLAKVEATLALVKDPEVKLPLHVALIKIDPFGQGKPINATFILGRASAITPEQSEQAKNLIVGFDRGDVSWLRGYCHFLAAWGEMMLAIDGQHAFECTAHVLFEKVETPHGYLLENRLSIDDRPFENTTFITDVISFVHQILRVAIKEPARSRASLSHLEAGVGQAKEMWNFILAEKDDDNEWIPNPQQKGVVGIVVIQEMVDVWRETLDECELVLKGTKLIPFWRGKEGERGVNLRRAITESQTFDLIEWIQGTAATPYLEKGEVTKFADPNMRTRLDDAFGGPFNIIGYGFWFN